MMVGFMTVTGALCFAWLGSANSTAAVIVWNLLFGFFSASAVRVGLH